ncbi:hypothetical protein DUNSADRAFT_13875 [Dunaliella salina]|uniref:Prolyl endopeptidase n=1 Tax=Dunaliella salina TaxID=3046 RepID=A0ABQ7H342_DUNSA|nr:hypothetical protein DUNSADRAFT_13875 [Dunaliella salina]|eukprot:KAF5841230.1 hypothetical protein DUNSADRAFT_13875 [Dunaliella salina]
MPKGLIFASLTGFAGIGLASLGTWRHVRHGGPQLRRQTNGNARWMSSNERALVRSLHSQGQGYLFRNWPAPGVRDAEKRALFTTAANGAAVGTPELEAARLDVLQAPLAKRMPKVLETHGDQRVDEYYWLRDDARKDKTVLSHLEAENAHTKAVLADTEPLQDALYHEMRSRIKEDDCSVPSRNHGYYYYSRTREGQQYRIHCRRRVPESAVNRLPTETDVMDEAVPEEVLLDENLRKEQGGHDFYMVRVCGSRVGDEDSRTSTWPYKVFRHKIGRPASEDVVVYEETDESFYVGVHKSRSEEIIFISSGSAVTSESRYIHAARPDDEFKVMLPRQQDVEYSVSHRSGHFFITLRNQERPNSELRIAPVENPTQQLVLLPHSREVKIEAVSVSKNFLAVFERREGLQHVRVYSLPADGSPPKEALDPNEATDVAFAEPTYSLGGGGQGDFDSPVLRLSYTSLTTPASIIDYHMGTCKRAIKKVQPVLGGFKSSDYKTERLWATAPDGEKVPISLVYRKGLAKLDGNDPLLLNGYGSYEISNDPYFSSNRLSLLDRGWVFAMAHIRGGGEMGRYWYEDGKYLKKKNTFTDFIAAAEHLVSKKYTNPKRMAIEGRSAGGLLMGGVLNLRPDLFAAAIMGVPFVDVLTTILDETIPLTIIEWEEWGNPKNKEYYDYIKSYSPVDNIRSDVPYPHILATGGLHDPRVGYWEPAKFVAKLRQGQTERAEAEARASGGAKKSSSDEVLVGGQRMLLLKMDMGAGHFSVTGRFERLKEVAFEYAFLLKTQNMLGVKAQPGTAAEKAQPGTAATLGG